MRLATPRTGSPSRRAQSRVCPADQPARPACRNAAPHRSASARSPARTPFRASDRTARAPARAGGSRATPGLRWETRAFPVRSYALRGERRWAFLHELVGLGRVARLAGRDDSRGDLLEKSD